MGIFDFLRRRGDITHHRDSPGVADPSRGSLSEPEPERKPELAATGGKARMVSVSLPVRAERAGDVTDLGRLQLPAGRPVHPDGDMEAAAVAWVTEEMGDHYALWKRLVQAFPETGLWPVVATGLGDELDRPWFDGEVGGSEDPSLDVEALLRQRVIAAGELQQDYGPPEPGETWKVDWAGLARGEAVGGSVELRCSTEPFGLLLVPVTRPSHVPSAIGWWGPTNVDLSGGDLSAVLRSWEDRYGAVLTAIGFDTMELSVAASPVDENNALLLAREHYAICPDVIDQGAERIEVYVSAVRSPSWFFWWD